MGKGWGYRNNKRSEYQVIIDSFTKRFENDTLKVYESKGRITGCTISIKALINKSNKTYKIIILGKDGSVKMNTYEDRRDFKSITDIKLTMESDIKMFIKAHSNQDPEIEKLSNEDFQEYISQFLNSINENNKRENTWIRLYNDMFERTSVYQDQEIVNIYNLYMNKIRGEKAC